MDACRGVAALTVVAAHTYGARPTGLAYGFANQLSVALPVLFAISGFLLFRPYLAPLVLGEKPPGLREFWQRRALRIVPGYWFALTAAALLLGPPIVRGVFSSHWWVLYGFGQAYSLTHNADGLPVAWTLSVEVSFYLCLPLFVVLSRTLSRRLGWRATLTAGLGLLALAGPMVRLLNTLLAPSPALIFIERITYGLPGQAQYFAVGMALAALSVQLQVRGSIPRPAAWLAEHPAVTWSLAGILFVFGATAGAYVSPVSLPLVGLLDFRTRFVLNGFLEAGFVILFLIPAVLPSTRRTRVHRLLSWSPLAFTGLVSYGIYLWHLPIADWLTLHTALRGFHTWGFLGGWLALFTPVLAASLLAGAVSYYLIELPFLRFKPGWRRRPAAAEAPGSLGGADQAVSRSTARNVGAPTESALNPYSATERRPSAT
jgi:peptidoglycan/LPS O-acetylase OafA/YrhL